MSSHDSKLVDYVKPSEAQLAARAKRNYAIGFGLLGFCVLIFVLMVVKLGGGS